MKFTFLCSYLFFVSSRRRHTRCALVTGVQSCALPISDAYAGIGRPQLTLGTVLPLPQDLPIDLLAHRPDVLATRARVDAATAGRAAARAAFYPDIGRAHV